jgi:hypothetical protein
MKTLSLFLILITTAFFSQAISLQEAIDKKLVNAIFSSQGSHTGKSVLLSAQNLSSAKLEINIEPGLYLEQEDTTTQDHIITETIMFVLLPKQKKEIPLFALCCERQNACPKMGSFFQLKNYDIKNIADLCKIIEKNKMQNYGGQEALWSLVNKTSPNDIAGEDSAAVMELRHFIGKTLKKSVAIYKPSQYNLPAARNYNTLELISSGNHYLYQIKDNDLIETAIYNQNNELVSRVDSALLKNVVAENGFRTKHNVNWDFTINDLDYRMKYYLRIKVNGVVQKEWKYDFMG